MEGGNRNLGNQKSRKTFRVEISGRSLMGRISTNYRYEIEIFGTDLFSLGELGVVNLEKLEKLKYV